MITRGHMTDRGSDQPRIAFLTDRPGSWAFGRIGPNLLQGFRETGTPFDLVYLKAAEGSWREGNVRQISLGDVNARSSVAAVARYLQRAKPSLTVASPAHVIPAALLAGRLTGRTVVPWEHTFLSRDMPELPMRMRALPIAQRLTYRLAPAMAVAAHDLEPEVLKLTGPMSTERLFHVPSPIDIESISARTASASPRTSSGPMYCATGRLQTQKGMDVLVEALRRCGGDLPEGWSLAILGEGTLRDDLESQIARSGLVGRVHLLGHQENPLATMVAADIFVHPARWEGCPVALLEALALGLPTVAAAGLGGVREILGDDEYGWLVPSEDPAALGERLVRLSGDPASRKLLGEKARQRALAYSGRAVAGKVIGIDEQLRALAAPKTA